MDKMSFSEMSGELLSAARAYKAFKQAAEMAQELASFDQKMAQAVKELKEVELKIAQQSDVLKALEEEEVEKDVLLANKMKAVSDLVKTSESKASTIMSKAREDAKQVVEDALKQVEAVKEEGRVAEMATSKAKKDLVVASEALDSINGALEKKRKEVLEMFQ